ncbi:uncharacterized protein [Pyrus communis]|uniref:uncharacterized protein n=1 Tax=Pyrus communis TaxID=23211 RepID=UPI0035C03A01
MLNILMATLYDQFIKKDIQNFEEFQFAILDIFNTFNSSLPGKHYEVPLRKEIEDMFVSWKNAKVQDRRGIFIQFMKDNVRLSKVDNATVITGVVTPPVAMAAKREGERVPQLKMIKAIPDVFFVPSATVLALISVKISRRIFTAKRASLTHSEPDIQMKTENIGEARAPQGGEPAPQGGAPAPLVIGNSHEQREIRPSNLHRRPSVTGNSHGEQEIRPSNPNRRWCLTKCLNEDCIYCARPCSFES